MRVTVPAVDRVLARVQPDANGCWIWPGSTRSGYGAVMTGSRVDGTRALRPTHVVVWEDRNGPVPAGKELDHLCRVPLCCNPDHLEPVTHRVNCNRMPASIKAKRRAHLATVRHLRTYP